ncbi:MAG: recombinase family protein [Blastocatellia bacterium]
MVSHRGVELSPAAQPSRRDSLDSACPYTAIHQILTNPLYAGAYTYGKTRSERYIEAIRDKSASVSANSRNRNGLY